MIFKTTEKPEAVLALKGLRKYIPSCLALFSGTFDELVLTLDLKRMASFYMSQHILPLNLNILLSMTTFWIDHKCVKARITIPLVVVLTLTKQTSALKATFPFQKTPVSMEYYLNFSIFFVFTVLIEYCLIGLFKVKMIRVGYITTLKNSYNPTTTNKLTIISQLVIIRYFFNNPENRTYGAGTSKLSNGGGGSSRNHRSSGLPVEEVILQILH